MLGDALKHPRRIAGQHNPAGETKGSTGVLPREDGGVLPEEGRGTGGRRPSRAMAPGKRSGREAARFWQFHGDRGTGGGGRALIKPGSM